ncbi:hypothetical protein [Bradyrhizobium sp. WSM2254]|uniref:hypothetical protein n=1 Tax=Bradyrhizobium sp. WSM2254 TaxID=1188263 RepID=UPI00040D49EB|nr:hypothetical protein [Bradyrhizobium sp. WSM2254]
MLRAQYGSTPEIALVGVVFVGSMLVLAVQVAATLSVGSELVPVNSTLKWACALVLIGDGARRSSAACIEERACVRRLQDARAVDRRG